MFKILKRLILKYFIIMKCVVLLLYVFDLNIVLRYYIPYNININVFIYIYIYIYIY